MGTRDRRDNGNRSERRREWVTEKKKRMGDGKKDGEGFEEKRSGENGTEEDGQRRDGKERGESRKEG